MPTSADIQSAGQPRVWVLMSKKLGDNVQVLSIANALGWPYEIKCLEFIGLNHFHFRFFGPSLKKVDVDRSSPLTPPWPDLVLTIGRRATPIALWIRRQSQGRAKLVQVGQSRIGFDSFDLIIANPQYHLPDHPNLFRLRIPLLYANAEVTVAAAATWQSRFMHLPRPWTALLVGGSTKPFTLDVRAAQDMMHTVRQVIARDGGSLLVTTSRRTKPGVTAVIETLMPEQGFFYRWSPDSQSNPYRGILSLADRFVVTGESISMLVEVIRQQKPLAIYPLPMRRKSTFLRSRSVLQNLLFPLGATPNHSRRLRERLGDRLVRLGMMEYRKDFSLFHQQVIQQGLAVWLGEPFPTTLSAPPDELPLVVECVKALFPQALPA